MPQQTCQMRALIKAIIAEGRVRPGAVFWTSPERAVQYIEQRVAEPIGAAVEQAGYVPGEAAEKNASSSAAPAGRSTDSAKSGEAGMVTSSSFSRPGPASAPGKPKRSAKRGSKSA